MKNRILLIAFFAGIITLSSCSKEEYMGPLDASGHAVQTRGGEEEEGENTGGGDTGGGITDSGHDSDYDSSNKRRKAQQ
jgi:hypothetical protein